MKQISLLVIIAFISAACQPDLPPMPATKTQAAETTGGTAKPATTTGATTTSTGTSTAQTTGSASATTTGGATTSTTGGTTSSTAGGATAGETDQSKLQPGDIPQRIFQLRQLEHSKLTAGSHTIDAFVADDALKNEEGLMWVTDKDLRDDQGMIFVMKDESPQSFWMENTLIPLDIVYMNSAGKVLNIAHGKPKDETGLPSTGSAKYVLELKGGIASQLGIGPGTKISIPASLSYKDDVDQPQANGAPPGQ